MARSHSLASSFPRNRGRENDLPAEEDAPPFQPFPTNRTIFPTKIHPVYPPPLYLPSLRYLNERNLRKEKEKKRRNNCRKSTTRKKLKREEWWSVTRRTKWKSRPFVEKLRAKWGRRRRKRRTKRDGNGGGIEMREIRQEEVV